MIKLEKSIALLFSFCIYSGAINAEYLYATDSNSYTVGRYSVNGTPVNVPLVNIPTTPYGVAIDTSVNIYVAEYTQNRSGE